MTFEEAMTFVERARSFPTAVSRVHPERFRALLVATGLDVALAKVPAIVVAGSAGKGSTTRMIAALARGVLDRVGDARSIVFGTKPPLRETDDGHRERYQSIGLGMRVPTWIPRERFAAHVAFLAPYVLELEETQGPLAPFDVRYAVLAREAASCAAALVVVEANIGLRNDVSRAWPNVATTVLTHIGVEHGALLPAPDPQPAVLAGLGASAGPAWHKAGGVFAGRPVVVSTQRAEVLSAITALARDAGASYVEAASAAVDESITLSVLGRYQRDNAATALLAIDVLQREHALPSAPIDLDRLANVRIPGRLELVARDPLTIRNVTEAPTKAIATLREISSAPVRVVLTTIERVEGSDEVVRIFARHPQLVRLYATRWHTSDAQRDMAPDRIAAIARQARPDLDVVIEPDAGRAIRRARAEANEGETVLLIGDGLANAWEEQLSAS